MRELVISERAEADLREIWHYSFDNWGEAQADRYLDDLDAGMRQCGAEPAGGKQRAYSASQPCHAPPDADCFFLALSVCLTQ